MSEIPIVLPELDRDYLLHGGLQLNCPNCGSGTFTIKATTATVSGTCTVCNVLVWVVFSFAAFVPGGNIMFTGNPVSGSLQYVGRTQVAIVEEIRLRKGLDQSTEITPQV